jgi:hypothetical protein
MARGERTATKRRARRLLLLGLGLGIGLLLAEIGVRVLRALGEQQRLEASQLAEGAPASLQPGAEATLPQIVRAAKNPSIIYELRPHLDVTYQGVRVQTNADGFRGPARSRNKPANGYRIVGLGDSVLFGWGVPFEACGLHVLERRLQAVLPQHLVEAIDTGVPGYNTVMEAQVLRDKGLAFAPDLVLVDFVGNDFDLPDFLWEQPDYWTLRRSFLLDLARRVVWQRKRQLEGPFVWSPYDDTGARYEGDAARVPEAYRHLVGVDAYRRAMGHIVALGEQHGFRVLVTGHHVMHRKAAAICEQLGVPMANPAARTQQWLHEQGDMPYLGSPLTLSAEDPHPSAMLHEWWAEAIVERLHELGWLPQ